MRHLRNLCILALLLALAGSAAAQTRPASYAEFDVSIAPGDGVALRAAITGGKLDNIYLRRGFYALDNPVVIDRTRPLFLHGSDRAHVTLVAKNPTQPLFLVQNAPLVNFASIGFWPTASADTTLNARAIKTVNSQPIALEIQDCGIQDSTLEFAGPGTYRVQSSNFSPLGRVRTPILINHPGADVLIFGGDASNGSFPLRTGDYAHVWQKQGRLRLYATTFEGGLGPSDIRIEAASLLGPHVIANVRSEGTNGAINHNGTASRLLYVPPTSEPVDVLVKANGAAWVTGPTTSRDAAMNCKLVWYNGAGTLWLFGNRADGPCGRNLVEGTAPQATIVSVGNLISSPQAFAISAKRIISASDLFNRSDWTGDDTTLPVVRWIPDGALPAKLSSHSDVPQPPEDVLPAAIGRPVVTSALPDMIDVKSAYGARGDGTTDDTTALQRALDASCGARIPKTVYLAAGTYRISNTLFLNHHAGGTCHGGLPAGGWIAGAGSGRTVLAMDPGVKRGVFATDGLAFATVQGITFRTFAWSPGDPKEPNVDLEFYPGYVATQQNNFYDVAFDGGYAAFATGVRLPTPGQCSGNVIFGGRFSNAQIGLVAGHFNALANGAYDSNFVGNEHALGSWTTDLKNLPPGGTFFAYRSTSSGTRGQDSLFAGSATGSNWYFYAYTSDAPSYFASQPTTATWPILYDRSRLEPRPGLLYTFDVGSAQGVFFLDSTATRSGIRVGQTSMGQSYAVKMQSQISDWEGGIAPAPNGQLDEISWGAAPAPGSALSAPGAPYLTN
jgi:hypothetical protein